MTTQTTPTTSSGCRDRATTYVPVGNVATPIHRPLPRRLLGVWAHPDDECYLSAGLMSRVTAAGGAVRLIVATRGEYGTSDPQLAGTERFGAMRQSELYASLGVLGVHDVGFLDLLDGHCDQAHDEPMIATIADEIDRFAPDAIVTFGPDGITGHADHQMVSRWTTAASVGRHADLLYATLTDEHVARYRDMHDALGMFDDYGDGNPDSIPRHRLALECSLDHAELIRKRHALAQHHSQTAPLAAAMGEDVYFSWFRFESFRRPTAADVATALRPRPAEHRSATAVAA